MSSVSSSPRIERALRVGQILGDLDKDRASGTLVAYRTLSGETFARLFLQHVLPPRFVRIRHYGLLAARRRNDLALRRVLLGAPLLVTPTKDSDWVAAFERLFGSHPLHCPACHTGILVRTHLLPPIRNGACDPSRGCRPLRRPSAARCRHLSVSAVQTASTTRRNRCRGDRWTRVHEAPGHPRLLSTASFPPRRADSKSIAQGTRPRFNSALR